MWWLVKEDNNNIKTNFYIYMIEVIIKEKRYEIKDSIDLKTYCQIYKLGIENKFNWLKIISLYFGIDKEEIEDTNEEIQTILIGFIITTLNKREESNINDFEKMTFGQFVDLEVYLSMNYINHLENMMLILSPYSKTASKALFVIENWLRWRNHVYKSYSSLFGIDEQGGDEIKNYDKMAVARSWYKIIIDLSSEDILKVEAIEMQPFRKILNFMSYKKEKMLLEMMEIKKREKNLKRR